MAKLIKILVASVGGGLVLGAAIRLGEAIAAQFPAAPGTDSGDRLVKQLGHLENRLVSLEAEDPATILSLYRVEATGRAEIEGPQRRESPWQPGLEKQAAEATAPRIRSDADGRQIQQWSDSILRLRCELMDWIDQSINTRMADLETRLRKECEHGQKKILDAFADSIQTRVIPRISNLEEQVAAQSAAMAELREYSLRTEQSMQKLLGGLDRLIVRQVRISEEAVSRSAPGASADSGSAQSDLSPTGQSPAVEQPRASRWKILS